ncbi:recombinase family protein [Clostridium sp. AM48-13]|uniref:recombinase family protein n=1 Tax=Clostridium sp. AM48-13 TaxID=2293034 RepID=UPI001A9B6515
MQKAKGGGYAGGGAPFGYESLRGDKKLYVNATEAKAVRRVFEIKQSFPDMTLKSIAEFMKMEGHKGRKGADFNAMLVKRILDKENFYRGYYNYDGIESVGEYEPLLS